jgi:very-short-patch-repair endonuclease/predicted transcriptional regulator of viral defense system
MPHLRDVTRDMRGQRNAGGVDALIPKLARGVDALIAELAGRQHGVVSREQLLALGLGEDAIDRMIRAGRLIRLHRSVYAVGHRNRSRQTAWMAAVLAGGEEAALGHRPAGALWGLCRSEGRPEVIVPAQRRPRRGIVFHRAELPEDERTVLDGIPVTTVPRTILDLATTLDVRGIEKAINEAEIKCLWDELSLHDLLHRYPRRPGNKNLRAALAKRSEGPSPTKSDLEEVLIRFADKGGFPRPETNVVVEGFEVDCVWRKQRVIIEVDGWETHKTRAAFERDREKSRILQAAGWRCVPLTHRQLEHTSAEVKRDVRRLLFEG